MDIQAQSLVLVDNEWVSRPFDVYQIMARPQQTDTEMRETVTKHSIPAPQLGLLSRTILPSPMSNFILPANIRHKDLTDIVLVGEDSVQLKEVRDYGHLRHVAARSDFKCRIQAAKVFGDPREIPFTKHVSSPLPKQAALQKDRRSWTGHEAYTLPPEVIVLTLTSRTLLFLWARSWENGAVSFCQKKIRLPAGSSRFDRLGTFLAIDPKRRAMATAAREGRFILYKTKAMETWREEISTGRDTTPIEDERIISIEGRIMHMDFLSSGNSQDDHHVVLLFIIAHHGKTKMTCFDWDCRQDLSMATARTERVLVDVEDHNPSLLIPLSRSSDFLLVCDNHISVYKDVLSGVPKQSKASLDSRIIPPIHPGDGKHSPRWVGWDKAPRNPDFAKEAFYIAREDGRIMYAERGPAGSVDINEAGEWPSKIDTAFACLSVDNSEFSQLYPDVLIAGGAGNDTLLCKVGAWPSEYSYASQYPSTNRFSFVESIPNWAPITGLSVTHLPGIRTPYERQRSAIFVANGASPHGEVSELRYGLHADVDDSFTGMNGCSGLWVVDYGSHMIDSKGKRVREHHATFVITLPLETIVIRVTRTQPESRGEFSGAWEEGVWDKIQIPTGEETAGDDIMRDHETISACSWSEDFAIQINQEELRVLRRPSLSKVDSVSFSGPLLLAASRAGFPFIAIAFREAGIIYLEIILVSQAGSLDQAANLRYQLPCDPTCFELLDIGGAPHVFVSTFDSQVMLLKINELGAPSLVLEESLADFQMTGIHMLCESAVVLSSLQAHVLVCATRTGHLLAANLRQSDSGLTITRRHDSCTDRRPSPQIHKSWQVTKMGGTSAQITHSQTDSSVAIASCGSDLCRISCGKDGEPSILEIESIWFTNNYNPGFLQSSVTAMHQLPCLRELDILGRNLGGFLFVVVGDQLLFSQLDSDVKWSSQDASSPWQTDARAVPRKLKCGAKPTNVVYMRSLRRLAISTMEAKEKQAPPNGYRVLHSTIKLLNVHDDKPLDEPYMKPEQEHEMDDRTIAAQYELKHAERVYSIVEWPFTEHNGKKYCFIIVGTGSPTEHGKEIGRRLIFNTGKSGSKLQLQKESTYESPVYCIAMWDNESTISVIGKTLSLDYFDSKAGRWYKRGVIDLPSVGIYISVKPPFVYVSTLQHSHLCYEVVQTSSSTSGEVKIIFEQVFTDSRERSCTHHLVLDAPKADTDDGQDRIILITDRKSASVSGLLHLPDRTYKNASEPLFEASLSRTVVRLERGDIRPPWRHTDRSSGESGVLVDDIIGACSDGTMYTFSILSQPARHLLRLVQNIIQARTARDPAHQHTVVKPRSGDIFDVLLNGAEGAQDTRISARAVDPRYLEKGPAAPREKHVDGDLLARWIEDGGRLEKLLREDTEKDVEVLFAELAIGFVKRTDSAGDNSITDIEELMRNVDTWIRDEVLRRVF